MKYQIYKNGNYVGQAGTMPSLLKKLKNSLYYGRNGDYVKYVVWTHDKKGELVKLRVDEEGNVHDGSWVN